MKDPYLVPEEDPLIILGRNSDVCMSGNAKDTKHTRHISRIIHFVRNSENYKMHKIGWCEGGLKISDIATKNFGENYLNPRMKYIIVSLGNWNITLVQEGWYDTGYNVEK